MGRRSVNTTKSGKFMNPTDQARKEARKKELKKNKKQRTAVRQAVLKAKDPMQLLEEAAIYDKQEYDPNSHTQLSERVIQEKRRKLMETFDRLLNLYKKEDADVAKELMKARMEYDKKRYEMMLYYEQVKLAERVKTDEIPLPEPGEEEDGTDLNTASIPLPPPSAAGLPPAAKSILKTSGQTATVPSSILHLLPIPPSNCKPAGPPPGPPPELSDSEEENEMDVAAAGLTEGEARQRKIRFADDKEQDESSGSRIKFNRVLPGGLLGTLANSTMSQAEREKMEALLSGEVVIDDADVGYAPPILPPLPQVSGPPDSAPFTPSATLKPTPAAPNLGHIQPPPLRAVPPIPPPFVPLPLSSIPLPPIPPPPRGPILARPIPPAGMLPLHPVPPLPPGAVFSAPPNITKPQPSKGELATAQALIAGAYGNPTTSGSSVIEAKPKLKNLIGDATKFVPTALKVRRLVKDTHGKLVSIGGGTSAEREEGKPSGGAMYDRSNAVSANAPSKDDAYDAFMREMGTFL